MKLPIIVTLRENVAKWADFFLIGPTAFVHYYSYYNYMAAYTLQLCNIEYKQDFGKHNTLLPYKA